MFIDEHGCPVRSIFSVPPTKDYPGEVTVNPEQFTGGELVDCSEMYARDRDRLLCILALGAPAENWVMEITDSSVLSKSSLVTLFSPREILIERLTNRYGGRYLQDIAEEFPRFFKGVAIPLRKGVRELVSVASNIPLVTSYMAGYSIEETRAWVNGIAQWLDDQEYHASSSLTYNHMCPEMYWRTYYLPMLRKGYERARTSGIDLVEFILSTKARDVLFPGICAALRYLYNEEDVEYAYKCFLNMQRMGEPFDSLDELINCLSDWVRTTREVYSEAFGGTYQYLKDGDGRFVPVDALIYNEIASGCSSFERFEENLHTWIFVEDEEVVD